MAADPCIICRTKPVKSNHRCSTCARYLQANGYDRSLHMVDLQHEREAQRCFPGPASAAAI